MLSQSQKDMHTIRKKVIIRLDAEKINLKEKNKDGSKKKPIEAFHTKIMMMSTSIYSWYR